MRMRLDYMHLDDVKLSEVASDEDEITLYTLRWREIIWGGIIWS